jgi:DNA replication and repair protein RecF
MAFTSLRTASFRNLIDDEVNVRGKDIFLIGENGQGKTNFLEALYYCSYASSFRGVRDGELVRLGEKDCSVSAKLGFIELSGVQDGIIASEVTVYNKDGKKSIALDGKRIEDRKELLATAPCIVFCHEDMDFVSGTPERRRWFFDQCQSLGDPLYLDDLRNYRKVLKTRNSLLKNDSGKKSPECISLLDTLDIQLVRYGHEIIKKRQEGAELFSRIIEPLYLEISGLEGVLIRYAPSWKEDSVDALLSELISQRNRDFMFGLSLSGPHRDRYVFTRKGREFSGKASTGQRRLLALLLRISQARIFSQKTGKKPVLLLDDVLLELDGEKRKRFLSLMPEYDQAFFTFLPEEPYKLYRKEDTIIYHVESGALRWET